MSPPASWCRRGRSERKALQMVVQKVTSEEFDGFVTLPENRDRLFELIGGEIVEVVSNGKSSRWGMKIGARITLFVEQHDLGYVTGADGGYVVSGEKYIPDVAFVSKRRRRNPPTRLTIPLRPIWPSKFCLFRIPTPRCVSKSSTTFGQARRCGCLTLTGSR